MIPFAKQSLHQALTFVVVGDHGRMTGMGRIDERRNPAWLAVIAEHHGSQIEPYLVRRREPRSQLVVDLDLFLDEFEVLGIKFRLLLEHRRRHGHWPERWDAQER